MTRATLGLAVPPHYSSLAAFLSGATIVRFPNNSPIPDVFAKFGIAAEEKFFVG